MKFAILVSRFNPEVTSGLLEGARQYLAEKNIPLSNQDLYHAPGAFEIPLIAQKLARTGRYAGVICLGCVIKGDTAHFELISLGAAVGILQASLATEVPIAFGILSTYTDEQAAARSAADSRNKGREAAAACLESARPWRAMSPDHDHKHEHEPDPGDQGSKLIRRALAVTVVFMAIELAGGWMANSLALISDGAHMLTDVGSLLLTLFVLWIARRPSNEVMSFGYHRAEILGALASALGIWAIAGALTYEACLRMQAPPEVNGPVVFVIAAIGFAANLLSMRLLGHGHRENLNVRAAYLHLFSDMLGSVGAIVAGAVLWATRWRPIDPLMTILGAALMLASSWSLVKESVRILMESTPSAVSPDRVRADLAALPGVREVHDLHIWAVGSKRNALSVHLVAVGDGPLLEQANRMLRERHRIGHTTIQIEHPDRFRLENCYDCGGENRLK